jgi:hypothetical protein
MQETHPELIAAAARLARSAGRGPPRTLVQLEGGKNNRVFRVEFDEGPPLVLKSYFSDPRDPRDRLAAEWAFISYAWGRGVRALPEPIAGEPHSRTALYGFVPGRKLGAGEIGASEVDTAADFVLAVNAAPRNAAALAPGSEACFSLDQHLATVERRVRRLATLDPRAPHRAEAERLVAGGLVPTWRRLEAAIADRAQRRGIDRTTPIGNDACCLSPSDFGFHNALRRNDGRLIFLDFEYAGRDDPAKLVCDFFCQPEIPVATAYFERFLARIGDGLDLRAEDRLRCRLLLDAYRIKWTCIILNDFLPVGAARRTFADQGAWSTRCAAQIEKAQAKLAEIALIPSDHI